MSSWRFPEPERKSFNGNITSNTDYSDDSSDQEEKNDNYKSYKKMYEESQRRLTESKNRMATLENNVREYEQNIQLIIDANQQQQININNLNKEIDDLKSKSNKDQTTIIENLKNEVETVQKRRRKQVQEINQLQQSLKSKENEIQGLNKIELVYKSLQDNYENLKKNNNNLIEEKKKYLQNAQEYQNKSESQDQTINQLKQSLKLKESEIHKCKLICKNLQENHKDLKNKTDVIIKNSKDEIEKKENHLQKIIETNQKHQNEQERKINQLQQFLELKENEIRESNNNLSKANLICKNLQDNYKDLKSKGNENQINLKKEIEEKENRLQDAQKIIDVNEQKIHQLQQSLELKEDEIFEEFNKLGVEEQEQRLKNAQQIIDIYQKQQRKQEQKTDQLQQSLELKENELQEFNNNLNQVKLTYNKEIEGWEQRLKSAQQIIDINQRHKDKQQQKIDRLQQSLELKENEIQESNNNLNKFKSLYNELQKNHKDLTNENSKEHQIIVIDLKNEIKELEHRLKNAQQIIDINQNYQNKIKSQEQRINQLLQSLDKSDAENDDLHQKFFNSEENFGLQNTLLDGEAQNHALQLNNDIAELKDNIKKYVTNLKKDINVNIEEVKKLLSLYKCSGKITNQENDRLLIQAVLQRYVIETILSYAAQHFRVGDDEITRVGPTKLRQQIYSILGNHGFSDVSEANNVVNEHPFITHHKEKLNEHMNELRVINNVQRKTDAENLAASIIREIIRIFWFRFKAQDPVLRYYWIPNDIKMDKTYMEGNDTFDDNENLYVDLCYFPLIGRYLESNNRKVCILAKVFTKSAAPTLNVKITNKFSRYNTRF